MRFIFNLQSFIILIASLLFGITALANPVLFETKTLLTGGEGGYHTYFAPAAIHTEDNNVLLFLEGRKGSDSDFTETHMLLCRSTDGGKTWGDAQVVWKDTSETEVTIGNPCPVYDIDTDTVWLTFNRNNQQVFVTSSTDDGLTWAEPRDISASVMPDGWSRYWTGPGHGLQLTQGSKAGRLIFPSVHMADEGARNVTRSHVIYSDDHGATWQIGAGTELGPTITPNPIHQPWPFDPNGYDWEGCECMAVELADGRLYLTIRSYVVGKKAYAISNDGGQTWEPMALADDLPGLSCQSSIIRLSDVAHGGENRILWSGITSTAGGRRGLSVFLSENEAASFPISRVVAPGLSSYSDMVVLNDQSVLLFYNAGVNTPYDTIDVAHFNLEWIKQTNPPMTVSNPEDFESYPLSGDPAIYKLTAGKGWSSDRAGTTDPDSVKHNVVTGQMLKMDWPENDDNNVIWWQQAVLTDKLQRLSYDVKLSDAYTAPSNLNRSMVGPQTEDVKSPLMVMIDPTNGVRLQVLVGTEPDDWAVLDVGSAALDTWYSVELEFSSLDQWARIRYKETSGGNWSEWTDPQAMGQDPDGWPIRFLSNDVVYYDNVALSAVAYKPGDANMDGSVDANDAALLAQNWMVQENATWFMGDFNDDGKVDDADATLLAVNWHYGVPSASVAEPHSFMLITALFLAKFLPWKKSKQQELK